MKKSEERTSNIEEEEFLTTDFTDDTDEEEYGFVRKARQLPIRAIRENLSAVAFLAFVALAK